MSKLGYQKMKLSECIAAWENGKTVEGNITGDAWIKLDGPDGIINFYFSEPNRKIRVNPELKPVDMSILSGSGIDFWFTNKLEGPIVCWLARFKGVTEAEGFFMDNYNNEWSFCWPRMNYWFSILNFDDIHTVRLNLLKAGFKIEGDGDKHTLDTSFRIVGLQDGYCWPWGADGERL